MAARFAISAASMSSAHSRDQNEEFTGQVAIIRHTESLRRPALKGVESTVVILVDVYIQYRRHLTVVGSPFLQPFPSRACYHTHRSKDRW